MTHKKTRGFQAPGLATCAWEAIVAKCSCDRTEIVSAVFPIPVKFAGLRPLEYGPLWLPGTKAEPTVTVQFRGMACWRLAVIPVAGG